jgi:5-methylcytosine-specific restriction protein B
MGLADDIRAFVIRVYIEPARRTGERIVPIRAGDVHREMGLKSRMPAVAGAIGAKKFEDLAKVKLISREGPHMGANLIFFFKILK